MIRKFFIVNILLLLTIVSCSPLEEIIPNDDIYITHCYISKALPIIGQEEYLSLLAKEIDLSKIPQNSEGKVFVSFIVDTNGVAKNHWVIKANCIGCEEEALRVFKAVNVRWNPPVYKGQPEPSRLVIPITF